MLNKEQKIVESIENLSTQFGIHPLDLSFNDWRSEVKVLNPDLFDVYQSLGVEFSTLKKANFTRKEVNLDKIEIQKRAKNNNDDHKQLEKESYFWSKFQPLVEKVFKDKLVLGSYKKKSAKKIDRILNLVLSDIHFGSDLDGKHNFIKYGKVEEARRLAKVTFETCEYKRQYRDHTKLNVHLLGDIIQNSLHDPRDAADLAEQINRATYALAQSLARLANEFPSVEIFAVPGNHDRWPTAQTRDVNHKDDSAANVIYFSLMMILQNFKNVKFNIPKLPFYEVCLFDKRALMTHGDTVFNFGYVGSAIDVKGARKQMNEWNGRRDMKDHISLFFIGHIHTGSYVRLPTGILMTNSSLVPSDEFALSVSIPYTANGSWLFESVPGHIVGDMRFLEVDENTDKNENLDKIIVPYNF